jgi:glucokinase
VTEVLLGLVVEQQLPALKRAPQTALEQQSFNRLGSDVPEVEAKAVTAFFLGNIHRRISILDQRFSVQCVCWEHRNTDACRDPALVSVNSQRLDNSGEDFSRHRRHLRLIRYLAQHNDELVTADAGYYIALAQAFVQPLGGLNKQNISRRVTECVIDVFKTVEVHEHDGECMTVTKDHCQQIEITNAVLAVAGPIEGERCVLTNRSWVIDARELYDTFRFEARIVNDFAAAALSLPSLTSADLVGMGGGKAEPGAPMAVLGPGSGLGVACLVQGLGKPVVIPSEGGHATLAGTCDREDEIVKQLRRQFGHVSAERIVSGDGLENIYQAIIALDGLTLAPRSAADITKCAISGDCQIAREALAKFCAFLGSFAGNVVLTLGTRGGVYIGGGISPRIVDFMARSEFRARFEAKGGLQSYLKTIPTYVIVHPAAAFLGLKSLSAL